MKSQFLFFNLQLLKRVTRLEGFPPGRTEPERRSTSGRESAAGPLNESGQALITLLFFMIIGITVISAAVSIVLTNSLAGSKLEQGYGALNVAESGVENALLRLDRDSTYTGETLSVGAGSSTITVSGSGPVTILSVGTYYNSVRKIQAVASKSNNAFTVTSWKEVY